MLATLTSYTKDSVCALSDNRCSARVRCIASPAAYKASQLSPSELIEDTIRSQGGRTILSYPPALAFGLCGYLLESVPSHVPIARHPFGSLTGLRSAIHTYLVVKVQSCSLFSSCYGVWSPSFRVSSFAFDGRIIERLEKCAI
jgi:hypothetical protein